MRRLSHPSILGVLSLAFLATVSNVASADDATPPPAPAVTSGPARTPNEKPIEKKEEDEIKRISLEINPLGITIGRYSISGEYVFAKHHAVTLNPFVAHVPVTMTANGKEVDLGSLTGFGGELGYRFYSGSRGANGFFAGPSFLFASYSQSAPSGAPAGASSDSLTAIGGAVDIGGQAIIGPGVVLGGGFGLQYTANSKDITTDNFNLASAVIAGGGIRPRFLFSAGYSF